MIFTIHDFTDFYVERVTAQRIKINDHSCFHNLWPNSKTKLKIKTSLGARGSPGVSGAQYSLCILRIERIGSGCCTGPERYSAINVTPLMLLQGCRFLSQCISVCVPVKENDSHRHIDCRHTCHLFSLLLFVFKHFNFPHLLQNPKEKNQEHNVTLLFKENS